MAETSKRETTAMAEKKLIEYSLLRFVNLLRSLGVRVSTGEFIDAFQALLLVDLLDRQEVEHALRCTLVKDLDSRDVFASAFAAFFVPPETTAAQEALLRARWEREEELVTTTDTELVFQGETLDLSREEKLFYASLPTEERQRIQDFVNNSSEGKKVGKAWKPMVERMVRGSLDYWRKQLGEERSVFSPPPTGDDQLDSLLAAVSKNIATGQTRDLYEDLKNIADKDIPRFTNLIRQMSRRMATRISRRYRRTTKVDRVDLRRSIRKNIRYGGTMLNLKYKTKRIQKPKLLVICDVSGSMARYATFVVQFLYGLSSAVSGLDIFVFAEELEDAGRLFQDSKSFEATMANLMSRSRVWGKGTNLGQALDTLLKEHPQVLTGKTIVVIVSDTKTLAVAEAARKMNEIKRRVRDIIWLNTLPKEEWPLLKSVEILQQDCRMYECYTLAHLEKIVRKNLAS